jgi:hypothetical protein
MYEFDDGAQGATARASARNRRENRAWPRIAEMKMAVWLPALKALLPYITQIVTAAIPAFTTRSDQARAAEVVPRQIQELQAAVTHNAESVKILADQLQQAITSIDAAVAAAEREMGLLRRLAAAAILLAVLALGLGVAAWLH